MPQPPRNRKDHYVPQSYLKGFVDEVARGKNDRPLWCLNKWRNQWERKSPKQICHVVGMYDFSNDAIAAEHADVTFKQMEDRFRDVREGFLRNDFADWKKDLDFLLNYMQMIRVRSPQYFVDQGRALKDSQIAIITSVDHIENKVTHDGFRRLTEAEAHDHTLAKMREEFRKGSDWMLDFHWQIRTTFDAQNPVVTSEQPLFVKGEKTLTEREMTWEVLKDERSEVWFPLCWQAAIVGRIQPFDADTTPFDESTLRELRHIVTEMSPQYVISPQVIEGLALDGHEAPRRESRGQR